MKNLVIGLGLGSALFYLLNKGKKVVNDYSEAIKKIEYKIHNIKNLEWVGGLTDPSIRLKFDLQLINPTDLDFSINAGEYVTLSKIVFFNKDGFELIKTEPNIKNISLKPKGTQNIANLPMQVPIKKLGVALDMAKNLTANDLNLDLYIKVGDREFKVTNRE